MTQAFDFTFGPDRVLDGDVAMHSIWLFLRNSSPTDLTMIPRAAACIQSDPQEDLDEKLGEQAKHKKKQGLKLTHNDAFKYKPVQGPGVAHKQGD